MAVTSNIAGAMGLAMALAMAPSPDPPRAQRTAPAAIQIPANTFIDWDEEKDGPRTVYASSGLKLEASAITVEDERMPVLKVTAPDGKTVTARGQVGFSHAMMRIGVGDIDPASPMREVVMTSFTGGAHCCTDVVVLDHVGGRWRTVELGEWDGEPLDPFPEDEDGDGVRDVVFVDQGFLYAFAAYAFSWAPPVVLNIRGGAVKDVTAAPRYRRFHEGELAKMRADCAQHNNGACGAMAAVAARVGTFDKLWPEVIANQDPEADWPLPSACRKERRGKPCAPEDEVKFASFPESLRWFLGDKGYLPAVPLPPKR